MIRNFKRKKLIKIVDFDLKYKVVVFRSNQHISASIVSIVDNKTVFSVHSSKFKTLNKRDKSIAVGKDIGNYLNSNKISRAVFDRNSFLYHGRIKQLVEAIRANNINI